MKKIQYNGISKLLSGITTKINSLIDIVELKADWEQTDPTAFDYIKNKPDSLDEKVKQENTISDEDYRVLLSKSANDVTENDKAWKNSNLKYNPSTGNLQTTKLNGNTVPSGSGNDTLAKTSDIPDMSDYIEKSLTVGLVKNDGTIDQSDYVESSDLATVATSGSYNDLIDKPTIPAGQVQSDWEQADNTAVDYIKNKPTLATVATSGSYNDLSNKPTIPDELADLSDDENHRLVTDTEKSAWDAKADISDITGAIEDLDVTGASNISAGKTIKAWSETDGKVSITTQNISITKSQISDFPTIPTVNDGKLTINQNGTLKGEFTANDSDDVTVNLTDTTYTASGLVSIDANNNITTTAEVNQNAFAKVKVGSTTVTADAKQDTLELVAGDNVTLTPDATNDKITIVSTDTNTHRPIKLNDTEILGNNTTPLNLKNGNNISMTNSSGTVTINATGIPTKTSDLTNDSNFVADANYVHTDVNFTSAYETKLSGIEPNAQVNSVTGVKGNSETNYRVGNVNITKDNIGLGSVPNVATNDQTPTFSEAGTRANIASGEKLSVIMGKIKKFFSDLKTVAFTGSYNDLTDKPTIPTNTDEKVKQTAVSSSSNANYRLLLSKSASNTEETDGVQKSGSLYYNPYDDKVTVQNVDISNTANIATAKVTSLITSQYYFNHGSGSAVAMLEANSASTASNPTFVTLPASSGTLALQSESVLWSHNNLLGAKNLIPFNTTEKSHTQNNVQFTLNEDGSIKAHITGTGSGGTFDVTTKADENLILPNGTYIFSGCPSGGSNTKYRCRVRVYNITTGTESSYGFDTGSGVTVTVNETEGKGIIEIHCLIYSGYNGSDLLFKPMIRPSSIADDTYTPPSQTNRQLTTDKVNWNSYVKNLIPYPWSASGMSSRYYRGITFTYNEEGYVTLNGTADSSNQPYICYTLANDSAVQMGNGLVVESGKKYTLSIDRTDDRLWAIVYIRDTSGTSASVATRAVFEDGTVREITSDYISLNYGSVIHRSVTFEILASGSYRLQVDLRVSSNSGSYSNAKGRVMLRYGEIVDGTWEKYAKSNYELTTQKAEVEDLEKAYTDEYNLLHQLYYDQIQNKRVYRGVTFDINKDSIRISGTASTSNPYYIFRSWADGYLPNKNEVYHLEGCPSGGSNNSYYLVCQFVNSSGTTLSYAYDYGNGVDFVLPDGTASIGIIFYVKANYAISGTLTITPRLTVARKFPTYQIGTIENGANASRAYAKNELMIWLGDLYRVTTAISSGGAISGKVTATTLSAEIKAIRDALNI